MIALSLLLPICFLKTFVFLLAQIDRQMLNYPDFILYSETHMFYQEVLVTRNLDNHNGVIAHLEPDILEYEVKWALGSITTNKASGGDGITVELFQILKDDAVKELPANLENSAMATGLEKVSFHSNPK